ncbi:MAG: glycosyltransferase family 4 protein [Phycisphaerales bacterium]|nr:glycosyltransferase family 4 protein [Phycisphaerales bacterium]
MTPPQQVEALAVRIAFIFGSIPTRNDRETDLRRAVIDKKDWLGQEAESVKAALDRRHPGSAVSVHIMYTISGHAVGDTGVEWFATRPMWPMTRRSFYQGKQWSRAFLHKILDWKPDLIHWQMNSYAYTFHLAARAFVKRGIPYVYQHHGPHLARKGYIRKLLQYPNKQAERGIYLTKYHEEMYREGLGLDPARSRIIRVGYDERFQPLDRAKCREKTGFKGKPILFWAAGLTKRKDPLTVLRAYEKVAPEFPESHFYMAGSGLIEHEVKALVAASPTLTRHVTLLGYVNNALLPEMENASDIYVMGSHGEGFCVSSMEAMACGLFPVLTTVPCFVEQTDSGRLGQLFEAGNVEQCAQCLRKAIGDVEYREQVRRELPETVRTLTWSFVADQLVDLYEEVLAGRNRM